MILDPELLLQIVKVTGRHLISMTPSREGRKAVDSPSMLLIGLYRAHP